MTLLLKAATALIGCIAVLCAATVCAAAGRRHTTVAADAGCVTRQCHTPLPEPARDGAPGTVHQPVADGDCRLCHDLDVAGGARFVRGVPAGADEGPESGRAWDLRLCAGCHGEALYARESPPGATGFAAAARNLHALHVQAGRGRRCLTCHDPHRSRQPWLLREQIPARGGARVSQQFRGEPKGGWCKTGCHAPKSYRR